jgi:A/G-specific adenine glycosylase
LAVTGFSQALLAWYDEESREMPWRGLTDPYAIWVSEIMLQQTRVETVRPYYLRWMALFPDINTLAQASEQDVLHAWEGLGYYARARNMLKAARMIVDEFAGDFPIDIEDIRRLPGVGVYTAAAISSIAFGEDESAIDGNIRRVLARLGDITEPLGSLEAEEKFRHSAEEFLPRGKAGEFNQAMMDLGATVCTPKQPKCNTCPVQRFCQAFELGIQAERPVIPLKAAVPHIQVTAAVIQRNLQVLIALRPSGGLLGGMWEFPGGKVEPGESDAEALVRETREELGTMVDVGGLVGTYNHAYTHLRVTLRAYYCNIKGIEPAALEAMEIRWVAVGALVDYPMGKIDRMISRTLLEGTGFSNRTS